LGQNGFNNINNVIGSDAGDAKDTLIGRNAVARFYLADGIYESENTLHFSGFEVLQGGSAEDTFIFNDNTNFAGSLNGGNGIDTLDYSACTIPATINLQTFTTTGITGNFTAIEAVLGSSGNDTLIGSDKGAVFTMISSGHGSVTVPGITGGVFTFTALENIQGGTGMDTLSFADYQEAVTVNLEDGIITGLAGIGGIEKIVGSMAITDRIIGRSSGSSFKITGLDSGTIDEISFESFEFLSGGNGNDSFAFSGKASLSGSIDGGAGNDTLDYSNYSSAVIFNLLTSSSTGLTGFSNINILVGSKSADTIIGSDADTLFIIDGSNSGSVNGIIFSSIENLLCRQSRPHRQRRLPPQ
jgi:hypothetical protein